MEYEATLSASGRNGASVRSDAATALAIGAVALAAALAALVWRGGFGVPTVVAALAPYAAISAVVLARVEEHHPHARFGAANLVTLGRAVMNCLLIGLLAALLVGAEGVRPAWRDAAEWLFFATAVASLALDGVDGFLARRQGLSSRFGARFDVEIDALLLTLLAVAAFALGKVGVWVVAMGATYYAFLAAQSLLPWLRADLPPSFLRKAVCVLQGGTLIALVTPFVQGAAASALAFVALAALWASFGRDVVWLKRRG